MQSRRPSLRAAVAAVLFALGLAGAPAAAATLLELGAAGDGLQDDTEPVQRAFANAAPGSVIDGEYRTFRVHGSIRIDRDLTLRNATFVQDSGADPVEGRRGDRTLLIRGTAERPLRVTLQRVTVDRGGNRHQGSPSDAAGIWIDHVVDSEFDRVEITGHGRGVGLLMADVSNVTVRNLWVHDMTWAPCRRQAEGLPLADVRRAWNSYLMVPMDDCHQDGQARQRIQEPLAGVVIVRSQQVRLLAPVIERLFAAFADGSELEWQTDGITIGSDALDASGKAVRSDILVQGARISRVWEGVDMTGQPLTGVQVLDAQVSDIHAIGIKAANGASEIVVRQARVARSGLAGFAVGGRNNSEPPFPASHSVRIVDSVALDTGSNGFWDGQATVAGFRVMAGAIQDPFSVSIEQSDALDEQRVPTMTYGFVSVCRDAMTTRDVRSVGHRVAAAHIRPVACR